MRVIAVDDDELNLEIFKAETEDIKGFELLGVFKNPLDALDYIRDNQVDAAVLDVEMPVINGIDLGARLRQISPDIAIIYISGHTEYAFDAFQVEACAYLTKPYYRQDIERAIERAARLKKVAGYVPSQDLIKAQACDEPTCMRNCQGGDLTQANSTAPVTQKNTAPDVYIRTFGRFEVFVGNRAVDFQSAKAKELMALLVDRKGGIVTTDETITYLWEDRPDDEKSRNLCRKVVQRLHESLKENGIDDIIIRHNRGRSIDISKVTCDYYQYLDGNEERKNEFHGEYMSNYSWAENTLASITKSCFV